MCTAFSNIQNLNTAKRDPAVVKAEIQKAPEHFNWCCRLYQKQIDRGCYFLHVHPRLATSWHEREIEKILRRRGQQGHCGPVSVRTTDRRGRPIEKANGVHVERPPSPQELGQKVLWSSWAMHETQGWMTCRVSRKEGATSGHLPGRAVYGYPTGS